MRIKDYLEIISKPPLSAGKISQMQSIKKQETKYKHLLSNFDRYIVNEIKHIKDFFDTVQDRIIELVKKRIRKACGQVVDEFRKQVEFERGEIGSILHYSQGITKFADFGHLVDLNQLLDEYHGDGTEIKAKISQTIGIFSNFDKTIDDWNTKLQKLSAKSDVEMKPRIDLSKLNSNILKRTREVNEVLHNLVPDNFGFNVEAKEIARNLESNKTEDLMKVYDQLYPPRNSSAAKPRPDSRKNKSRSPYGDGLPKERHDRNDRNDRSSELSHIRSSVSQIFKITRFFDYLG